MEGVKVDLKRREELITIQKELLNEIASLWEQITESPIIKSKRANLKKEILKEFYNYFNERGCRIEYKPNNIIELGYNDYSICFEEDSPNDYYRIKITYPNGDYKYYSFYIDISDNIYKNKSCSYLYDGEINYPGGVEDTKSVEFIEREVINLQEDVLNFRNINENIKDIDVILKFNQSYGISGEFKNINHILEQLFKYEVK